MNRRTFIKSAVATAVALSIPPELLQATKLIPIRLDEYWVVNPLTKRIEYTGPSDGPRISVKELYAYLKKEWEEANCTLPIKF